MEELLILSNATEIGSICVQMPRGVPGDGQGKSEGSTTYVLGTGTCHEDGYRSFFDDFGSRSGTDFHNFGTKCKAKYTFWKKLA